MSPAGDEPYSRLYAEDTADIPSRPKRRAFFASTPFIAAGVLLSLVVLILIFTGFRGSRLPPPKHFRILPLGDSITYGLSGDNQNGYRLDLLQLLEQEGLYVTYVGSRSLGTMEQNRHDGWPGATIAQVQRDGLGTLNGTFYPQPNLILLMIGTNNLNARGQTALGMTAELDDLLDEIYYYAPDVCVVLSQTIDCKCADVMVGKLHEYNRNIAEDIVPRFRARGHPIVMVEQPVIDMTGSDGIHPKGVGYKDLARAFMSGIMEAASKGLVRDTT